MTLVAAAPTTTTVETRSAQHAGQIPASLGLVAGEALLTAAPCYIKASDGKVYMSNATAANEAAKVHGWTGKSYASGEPVTLWKDGIIFEYGTGLTPGATLYVGTTAGRLDTAATTGDGAGVATVLTATHIQVVRTDPVAGITDASVAEADIAANSLTGLVVGSTANANVIGGIPVLHRIDVVAGTTGDVDTVLTHKTRVCEVWLVKRAAAGGGAGTIQVKNGSSAITDAMSINVNDQIIVRAASIDDAQHEIAAAGTLKITRTRTASTDETCTVYVLGLRVA